MDKETMMNNHRKTAEAISDVSKMAVEVMKSISMLQTQYMRQTFEDFNAIMKDSSNGMPFTPENLKDKSEYVRSSMTKAADHVSNISSIIVRSNSDMHKKMQNHAKDAFEEMKYSAVGQKKPS